MPVLFCRRRGVESKLKSHLTPSHGHTSAVNTTVAGPKLGYLAEILLIDMPDSHWIIDAVQFLVAHEVARFSAFDNTDAMIFYSSQGNACASDMVGIVNSSKDKSLQDYKSRARKLSEGVSPGHATFGGELADKGSSYDDSKSDDNDAQDGKKSGNKSAQDIINSVTL
ncbi:hypothetical protein MY10362_004740 [Beauveria mimosiformis]